MTYYLFIWAVVTGAGTNHNTYCQSSWQNQGAFTEQSSCVSAAKQLGISAGNYCCVPKDVNNVHK